MTFAEVSQGGAMVSYLRGWLPLLGLIPHSVNEPLSCCLHADTSKRGSEVTGLSLSSVPLWCISLLVFLINMEVS